VTALAGAFCRLRPSRTRWNSCATLMAATRERPSRAASSRQGCITSSLRTSFANLTTGMPLFSANQVTAWRNMVPRRSNTAGDTTGIPRCL
jgi:hypothetical protein